MTRPSLVCMLVLFPWGLQGVEPNSLHCLSQFSNVLGGGEATLEFVLDEDVRVPAAVDFRVSLGPRTLSTGKRQVGSDRKTSFRAVFPEVPAGTVLPVTITALLSGEPGIRIVKMLYVYPSDPFQGRRDWLTRMNLKVFDPIGETAKLFTAEKIPFTEMRRWEVPDEPDGLLIIGERVDLNELPEMTESCWKAVQQGQRILCMAPINGALPMPAEDQRPSRFVLGEIDDFRRIDKLLNVEAWIDDHQPVLSRLALNGAELIVKSEPEDGYEIIDAEYRSSNGRIVICGSRLVSGWQNNPVPRQLLSRLFESFSPPVESQEEGKPSP